MPSPHRPRRPSALVAAVGLVLAAANVLWFEPVTGPHLAHLWADHGLEGGDLLALPLLVGAAAMWWIG